MAHIRKQIRDAVAAALGGLPTTGSRVFPSRVYNVQPGELPCLLVYTRGEDVEEQQIAWPDRLQDRSLELVIEAYAQENDTFDDTCDQVQLEVEQAIAANQGAGGCKYIRLESVESELEGDGDRPAAARRMTFRAEFYTAQSAPDVAL